MKRYAIVGNSGSGKSWLARDLSAAHSLPVLDLDTIVWEPGKIAVRRPAEQILQDLDSFFERNKEWVIEGCYGSLIEHSLRLEPLLIFLNPGFEKCKRHCLGRPHEPHKYKSQEEQDKMLGFLLKWVEEYYTRQDDMSLSCHRRLFDLYGGAKEERA